MPPFVGINFYQQGSQGWSESYCLIASDYTTAASQLNNIALFRQTLMPPDSTHIGGRVSDVTIVGDALVNAGVGPGSWPSGAPNVSVASNVVLLVRQNAGVKPHAIRAIHALPVSQVTGQAYTPSGIWTTPFSAYLQYLQNNTYILTTKGRGAQRTFTTSPISTSVALRMSTRKEGRPFGARRGRRRVA